MDFITLQAGQALQFQIQNGFGLCFRQVIKAVFHLAVRFINQNDQRFDISGRPSLGQQSVFGFLRGRRGANQLNDRIKILNRNSQTNQGMRPVAGLIEFINRPAADNFFAEFDKGADNVFQIQHNRAAVMNSQNVHAETGLQRRIFIQLIQNDIGLKITLQLNNNPDAMAVGLVANLRNAVQFLFFYQFGDTGNHCRLINLIGNFVDNNRLFILADFFNGAFGSHHYRTASGIISRLGTAVTQNQTAGRKIRPGDNADQIINGDIRVVDIGAAGVQNLAKIMRRNIGGHTDGNTVGAVDQQVWISGRQNNRFLQRFIIVRHKVNGVLVDIFD